MSDTTSNPPQARPGNGIKQLIRSLGPGIMMASAAVGGSHLVASTKAGAIYGWQLAAIILLVNLFKYPFFRAGIQYTMGTGKSLVEGYDDMGRGYLLVFFVLNLISSIVNTAALLLFSASLLGYFMPGELPLSVLSAMVLAACLIILMAGHYKALDGLSKVIMSVLVIATISAVVIAAGNGSVAPADYEGPSAWTLASFGFIVVMMGWMPAPIEISCLTSLWLKSQRQEQTVTTRSALFDFNVGYIGTAILAIVFLSLGALVLYGSGTELKASGIGFSHQLVSMYASTIGEWSRYLIAVIAFFCIFGSTITVIDGYSRALAEAQLLIQKKPLAQNRYINGWMIIVSVLAMAIILFFTSALMPMMNFAMVLAFMTTPVFAYLNYRLLTGASLPAEMKLSLGMKYLSWAGLVYLYGFLVAFIWWKWFM
ncbi:divalent metal cation transporter [Photobacterium sp. CCB-ST2H9]|uniref:NRAMP family divalent metal transporter n=1 Tax=Photobacterium sp. CCB-ST2H9 TaxID=2912855 RepID=UPI002005F0EF|nr:divalent metal cation transporter [Photobacterium sp. CCB-ST2H9]UTM60103.1 divalent metal cation transporter [Photobacterium sp. CCB-ST2H9]